MKKGIVIKFLIILFISIAALWMLGNPSVTASAQTSEEIMQACLERMGVTDGVYTGRVPREPGNDGQYDCYTSDET